ncbi:formate dehydrogenase accessory sulfurtransferase FdhD [Nannocystaceae bacterium ST9]
MPDAPEDDMSFVEVERLEWRSGALIRDSDQVAREEPLELRIAGVAIAVVMRTPGHDEELARGFLLAERIVARADQILTIRHCTTVDVPEAEDNILQIRLADEVAIDLAGLRRNLYTTSSCGVCGKASIAAALAPSLDLHVDSDLRVAASILLALPERLRADQRVFDRTGGLHAAGLFDRLGQPLVVREDVGRHNAVDKVIGWAAERGLEFAALILFVSGRVSFELIQKAAALGVPILAAVSAPSSLAIELARAAGITLIGFVRGERMCVYSGEQRIDPAA